MNHDTTHTIISSAKRFLGGTMLSRISGLLRDVTMAFAFGTQEAIAAFLVAFRFAHLLRRLFGEGALQTAFIPHFETLRKENPERACHFFRDLAAMLTVGLSALIFCVMLGIGFSLVWFDFSEGNREILFLTMLLMPSLLFICLFGLNASLLQCEKGYFISGVAPVAFNVVWIIGTIYLWNMPTAEAMPWLAGWVILACLCQWLITLPNVLKILRQYSSDGFLKNVNLMSLDIKGLYKPLILGITGVAATQINSAVDTVFARYASAEGPALLWYALRIQQLPLALFGVAIAGALLPPLTRAIKAHDMTTFKSFLAFTIRRSLALTVPITMALLIFGDSCINLIYGRGDFSDASTAGTTLCLWGYSIGLVPMTLVLIVAPAFYAQSQPRIPAMASVASMGLNIILNAVLIMGFGFGPSSVAIATSVSALVNFAILAIALGHFGEIAIPDFLRGVSKILACSAIAGCVVIFFDTLLFDGNTAWNIVNGAVPNFPRDFQSQLLRLSVQSLAFVGALGFSAWAMKADERILWQR